MTELLLVLAQDGLRFEKTLCGAMCACEQRPLAST